MGVVFDNVVRISANVTGDFGNVTGLRSGAELRGEDGRKGLVLTGQAGACTYRLAFGPRADQKVLTMQGAMLRETDFKQTLCADIDGLSLHAAVRCAALTTPIHHCSGGPARRAAGVGCLSSIAPIAPIAPIAQSPYRGRRCRVRRPLHIQWGDMLVF